MVKAPEARAKTRGRIQIGADDPSLTGNGGMLAVTELCGRLGLISELDAGIGPVKQRARGFSGGQVLAGMAAAQLAGEDFLVGLDRVRADAAGQQITLVPGLAASTATGIARRFTSKHWRGAEKGLAQATARMVDLLPAERAAELSGGPVTIDIDATDVEVYGNKKRGVDWNYQGQRAGLPDVAVWAETEIPLAADLRFAQAWRGFADAAEGWVDVVRHHGPDALREVWLDVLAGRSAPRTGHVVSF